MFYYLLYNSSFSFIVESRLFSTILYGSILYIVTHAILNFCDISILNIINNYYWTLFALDIISFTYSTYQSFVNVTDNGNINDSGNSNNLNVSFNLLKNKINTILDRKNDLTITEIPINQKNNNLQNYPIQNQNQNQNQKNNNNNNNNNTSNNAQQSKQLSNKFSTPISHLQNIKQGTNQNKLNIKSGNQSSTPISLIRNNINIVEPFIDDENNENNDLNNNLNNDLNNNQYEESVAGSDVGSVMDLADFETTL